jgi:hypothetical protein
MKRSLLITLIVLFAFSFAFVACNKDDVDTDLNGKWLSSGSGYEFKDGEFTAIITVAATEIKTAIGTYDAKDSKMTMEVTQINLQSYPPVSETPSWQTKDSLLGLFKNPGTVSIPAELNSEDVINEIFTPQKITYFIDGRTLILVTYDEDTKIDTYAFLYK